MGQDRADSDDGALMLAYGTGDGAAFEELFDRYAGKVFNFFLRATGDQALAEDLFQTTFLRLHGARKSFVGGSFKAFLFTIAANLLRDQRGKAAYRRQVNVDSAEHGSEPSAEEATVYGPEDEAAAGETHTALQSFIRELPAGVREAMILSRFQGLSHREIGEVLGVSTGAVKVRLYRGLKQLRAKLEAAGEREKKARHG